MDNLLESNDIYKNYSTNEESNTYNNALGTYNTEDFTIRLAYFIHDKLENLETGNLSFSNIDVDTLRAYSTYFHETIHWRQHIGSTSGFILSLIMPFQYTAIEQSLKIVLKEIGPIKSLKQYYYNNVKTNTPTDELFINLNNIFNNFYDMLHYKNLVINPKIITQEMHEEFYLSYGHATAYTYINLLDQLSYFFDDKDKFKINNKIESLKKLISSQQGSPYVEFNAFKENNKVIPPLGVKQIYEGQARFLQLQLLYFSNKNLFNIEYFKDKDLLSGIYGDAFELYLKIIEHDFPEDFGDSIIAIFLIVCDLAINPSTAFPLEIEHDDSFFFDAIPGIRFYDLCNEVKNLINSNENISIKDYSKDEYDRITSLLCENLCYPKPNFFLNKIINWKNENKKISEIIDEEIDYSFKDEFYQVRFLFSKFITFSQDKLNSPEFFCWTGACSAGKNVNDEYRKLTEKYKAPFINQKDLDVYAASIDNINENNLEKMKDSFTLMNIISNLTRQWINNDGDFKIDFIKEINGKYSYDELYQSYSLIFKNHFGVDFEQFKSPNE
ncbi:hypothetical protein ABN056_02145 [Providencia vermicola]|uniref:hypothetical protein n=1 Tax=Providencia vermicola TaxID=333965 RepID=UPI0032D9E57B